MGTRRAFIKITGLGLGGIALGGNAAYRAMAQTFGNEILGASNLNRTPTYCEICFWKCAGWVYKNEKGDIWKIIGNDEDYNCNGRFCPRGTGGVGMYYDEDRLKTPLIREGERGSQYFREATWDEAIDLVAGKLAEIKDEYGARAIVGLSSAKCTNEENYVFQKFIRAAIGTNSVDHCARLCHAPTVAGLVKAFGSGAMTNSIQEMLDTDCFFVIGSNTTENHPVIAKYIRQAVLDRGAKLIVADPRKIGLVRDAAVWLRQRGGTDVALMNGMMNIIIEEGLQDMEFIAGRTENYEELKKTVEKYTPERVERITGIPAEELRKAARLYAEADKASIIFSMGITQHTTGTDNVLSTANLSMLTGNVGKYGAGVNPLRGQNNVQGACDMGALPNVYNGYQNVEDPAIRLKFEEAWNAKLDERNGLTVVEAFNAVRTGDVQAMYIMGENPMLSEPDIQHVEESLKKLSFLVVQDIFMTETAELADVVLPTASFAEKNGTFVNTERKVQRVRAAVESPGISKEDWVIIKDLSNHMGYSMKYANAREIMKEISDVTPSYCGINYDRIENDGIHWPCPTNDHPGTPCLHIDQFSCGLGVFHAIDYIPPAEVIDKDSPLYLTTGRVLYQYHTGTMTMKSEGLNELAPTSFVEISSQDASAFKIGNGDLLKITSRRGEIEAEARISEKAVKGTVFIPFHYAEGAANILTNAALDPVAKIPEYKVCAVKLSKAA